MTTFYTKRGRNIRLKGAAEKKIIELSTVKRVAVIPSDFKGIKVSLAVKADDRLQIGSPVLFDKNHPEIKVVSPVSGKVIAVNRGEKRALLEVVIESDGKNQSVTFPKFLPEQIENLSKQDVTKNLLAGGLWPSIRQRPFSKIAHPNETPKSIFVQAMNTEPLAADADFILRDQEKFFQTGLDVIKKLTRGKVHLCFAPGASSKALTQAKGVDNHQFFGPHPAGNVSTHIHYVDPIRKGDLVWYLGAQDVLRIGKFFLTGQYPSERYVALTGPGADKRGYVKTILGVSLNNLFDGKLKADMRYISGNILTGRTAGQNGYLGYYDSQVTVIPEGGQRKLLGWLTPGFGSFSFSNTFVSSMLPSKEVVLDTDTNGSERAIVLNDVYDKYVPLDVMTYFLLKAIIIGDIEEAEKLGLLECDEEDFALCTFACPSKVDVGAIVRRGLEMVEKEG